MDAAVTVVVYTCDRPTMLIRAFASITPQTSNDYEVVIVNDADDEVKVRSVVKKQKSAVRSKITIITNEVSRGREAALESGLFALHNRYHTVHDDDDSWYPHFLEKTVVYLDEHPGAGGVVSRYEIVRERMHVDGTCIGIEHEIPSTDNYDLSLVGVIVEDHTPPISQLIRRGVVDYVSHWDSPLQTQVNWDFNLRLLADSPVGFTDGESLAYWHHHDTMDAFLDNSVITDACLHKWDNLCIRDHYLRAILTTEDSLSPHLGQALLSVKHYRRICEELAHVDSGFHSSLNFVHVDMSNTTTALHQQMHEPRGEVSALREHLDVGLPLCQSLRRMVPLSKRIVYRLLRR